MLPRDIAPAAAVLGLDPEQLDMAALGVRMRGPGGAGVRGAAFAEANGGASGASPEGGVQATSPDSLRARVQRGELSPDSARTIVRGMRGPGGRAALGVDGDELRERGPGMAGRGSDVLQAPTAPEG